MRDPVDVAYDKSHYNQDAPVIDPKELANETSKQLDKLLADGNNLLTIIFFDVISSGFNAIDLYKFGGELAKLINCPSDDGSGHIKTIRDLFKPYLQDEAAELAQIKLERLNHE